MLIDMNLRGIGTGKAQRGPCGATVERAIETQRARPDDIRVLRTNADRIVVPKLLAPVCDQRRADL